MHWALQAKRRVQNDISMEKDKLFLYWGRPNWILLRTSHLLYIYIRHVNTDECKEVARELFWTEIKEKCKHKRHWIIHWKANVHLHISDPQVGLDGEFVCVFSAFTNVRRGISKGTNQYLGTYKRQGGAKKKAKCKPCFPRAKLILERYLVCCKQQRTLHIKCSIVSPM